MCFTHGATLGWCVVWWCSAYASGAFSTWAMRMDSAMGRRRGPRLRTPMLAEHVKRLRLGTTESVRHRGPWLLRAPTE